MVKSTCLLAANGKCNLFVASHAYGTIDVGLLTVTYHDKADDYVMSDMFYLRDLVLRSDLLDINYTIKLVFKSIQHQQHQSPFLW